MLKLIEEPPKNSIFILVAEAEDLVLNTIRSRCQLTRLRPVNQGELFEFLIQNSVSISNKEVLQQAAFIANGNIHKAIELAGQTKTAEQFIADWFVYILKNKVELVSFIDQLNQLGKERVKNILNHGTQMCRESLILRESKLPTTLIDREKKLATWLGAKLDVNKIHQLMVVFEKAQYAINRNGNMKLLLLNCSIKIDEIIQQRELV